VIPIYTGILSHSFSPYLICLFLGYALQDATMKFDVAGIELTNYLIQLFRLGSDTTFLKFS
jgi:actin-related protein